jgi:hypothetical protein
MAYKQFDKKLFEKYDQAAKEATLKYLRDSKCTAEENTQDRYAQDIIYNGNNYAECEVKRVWKGYDFPFDSVQLPERKRKFFNKPTLFFIWNEDCTRAATFHSEKVKHLVPVEVSNKYIKSGEKFFQIPLDLVIFTC